MRRRNGWGDESEVAHLGDGSRRFLADRRRLRAAASRPHTHETSGLGAAIDAAVGLASTPRSRRRSPR